MAKETKKTTKKTAAKKTAAKKAPAAKKAAAPKKAAAKKTTKKTVTKKAPAVKAEPKAPVSRKTSRKKVVTPEEHYRMVQDAAYYIAERNGFGGDDHRYWVEAENQINKEFVVK
jgi:hypothetical protein